MVVQSSRHLLSSLAVSVFLLLCSAGAQITQGPGSSAARQLQPGLVVESVGKNSAGEKAGLQSGDVLLSWRRGETRGVLESPFELSDVETEQGPRGPVIVEGLRGAEGRTWSLGPAAWEIRARPNLLEPLRGSYEQGKQFADAGKSSEAAARWREAAGQVDSSAPPWLGAWFLARAADALAERQQWKEADEAYQSAVDRASGAGPLVQGQLFRTWARTYQQRSNWANAEKQFQSALARNRKSGLETLTVAANLNSLGTIAWERGSWPEAEEQYQQALDITRKLAPGSLAVAETLNDLGRVVSGRGNVARAEEYCRQALAIENRVAPESLAVAETIYVLGRIAWLRGSVREAEDQYERALDIRAKLAPGGLAVAETLNNLGFVLGYQGNLEKAEEYSRQALDIEGKLAPGSLELAVSFNTLGLIAWQQGDLAKAEEYCRLAIDIRKRLAPGSLNLAVSFNNLGIVALYQGDFAKAQSYLDRGLEIRRKLAPGSLDVAASFNNLGMLAAYQGDLAKAEGDFRQALSAAMKLAPVSLDVAGNLNNLGLVLCQREKLAEAEDSYSQALVIEEKLGADGLHPAETIQGLGQIALLSGDLGMAEQHFRQALTLREKLSPGSQAHAELLAAMASVLLQQRHPEAAARFFAQAVTALESQTARLGGSDEVRIRFRANHSAIYQEYIDLLLAQKQPKLAFQVLERSRAQSFLESLRAGHIDIHAGVPPDLLSQEKSLRADVQAKSNRRIQLLTETRGAEQVPAVDKEIAGLLEKYKEVEGEIRINSPAYAALTQPQPLGAKQVQQLLDSKTVLLEYDLAKPRSYLFALTSRSLTVYRLPERRIVENQARRLYDLLTAPNKAVLGETPAQRQRRLAKAETEYAIAGAALSQAILAPAAAIIKDKRLLIVSDGALSYVPFAALPVPSRPALPLLTEHEIVSLPSASVLLALRQDAARRPQPTKIVALFADPVFDAQDIRVEATQRKPALETGPQPGVAFRSADLSGGGPENPPNQTQTEDMQKPASDAVEENEEGPDDSVRDLTRSVADLQPGSNGVFLPRLQFSRREAAGILAVTPPGEAMQALDFDASRSTAISRALGEYRIVHFATHGLLNNRQPELSGLVLSLVDSQGKAQNGFLNLQDIYNMTLHADLVVLSACATGLGKEVEGEGITGITRAFMYAGASRVVASLWNIDDEATAELMAEFYKAMEQGGMQPAAALRTAQIAIWKQQRWAAPYYWAAFQMQGEWR